MFKMWKKIDEKKGICDCCDTDMVKKGKNNFFDIIKKNKKINVIIFIIVCICIIYKIFVVNGEITYSECTDLEIQALYFNDYDNYGYFTVKNVGDKVIKDFTVAYIGFDSNGNNIKVGYDEDIFEKVKFETANIIPGSVYGLDSTIYIYDDNISYFDIAIESITYKDGEKWEMKGIENWANKSANSFDINSIKETKENLKTKALLAEKNDYLKIKYRK